MQQDSFVTSVLSYYFNDNINEFSKINFIDKQEFSNNNACRVEDVSQEKRVTLFGYLFLYNGLVSPEKELDNLLSYLQLPLTLKSNCHYLITEERIQYIYNDFKEKNKEFIDIFNCPDEYIVNLITDVVLLPLPTPKLHLKGLNAHSYEHPMDRVALEKLSGHDSLEKILRLYSKYNVERLIKIQYTGANYRVTKSNLPYLYDTFLEACSILDIENVPELYLEQGFINACTIGADKPIVVLSNSCLSLLSHDELLFILGHELGHIKSQHVLYHMLAEYLPVIIGYLGKITLGLGELIAKGVEAVLLDWHRKSEFSADRAGLLACQHPESAISTMVKLAGFPPKFYENINVSDFLQQAEEFRQLDHNIYDSVMKFLSTLDTDHPWTVMRAYELQQWIESGEYEKVLHNTGFLLECGEKTIFCSSCGAACEQDARFCFKCGCSL